jgi:hypothetical protein
MTKIAKDCLCSGSPYSAFSEMRNRFAKAENLQDKAYDRVEGEKLSVRSREI